jgi:putative oxidoreductase
MSMNERTDGVLRDDLRGALFRYDGRRMVVDPEKHGSEENRRSHVMNATSVKATGKGLNIALWVVAGLLTLAFAGAGVSKLTGQPQMVGLFEAIGMGQWFRYLTGTLEVLGAVLLVVPKGRAVGAALLLSVMLGAIVTHLAVLHNAPGAPAVLAALTGFVLWGRRSELMALIGR